MDSKTQSANQHGHTVVSQWNATHGEPYFLATATLEWNLQQQNLLRYWNHEVAGTGVMLVEATPHGVKAGVSSQTLWLSLWGKILAGQEHKFVDELLALMKATSKTKLQIGGDEFHFVPGIPLTEAGSRLRKACVDLGFEGAESADYFGNIGAPEVSTYIADALRESKKRALSFREVSQPEDFYTMEIFLSTEFPGRWTREFLHWKASDQTQRASWHLLEDASANVIGFARMAVRGRVKPLDQGWTPGALRLPSQLVQPATLVETDCSLGPIGVANSQRGHGTGKILLGLVLETLRRSKTERICIDWTNAFKYYEPLNFDIARRYWTAWISRPL